MRILILLGLVSIFGCSSTPTKYLRQNCESVDHKSQVCPLNSLCYCEDVPKNSKH